MQWMSVNGVPRRQDGRPPLRQSLVTKSTLTLPFRTERWRPLEGPKFFRAWKLLRATNIDLLSEGQILIRQRLGNQLHFVSERSKCLGALVKVHLTCLQQEELLPLTGLPSPIAVSLATESKRSSSREPCTPALRALFAKMPELERHVFRFSKTRPWKSINHACTTH